MQRTAENGSARTGSIVRAPAGFAVQYTRGRSVNALAEEYGVARNAVYTWLESDDVKAEIEQIRQDTTRAMMDELADLRRPALDVVREILEDVDAPACPKCGRAAQSTRLSAATLVFDRAGVPKRTVTELTGSVASTGILTTAEESEIVINAADILSARGHTDLAAAVRATVTGTP